ncbi:MAG: HEAT repeat domain-containing protein [Treponema sp.]
MKKIIVLSLTLSILLLPLVAEDTATESIAVETPAEEEYEIGTTTIPAAKRPKKPSEDELRNSMQSDESENTDEYVKKCKDTFKYGLETEISELIDELTKNEDMRFVDSIYDLFQSTKDINIKQKVLAYFTKLKDPCLEDYAVTIVDDPYDEKKDTVSACFNYISAVNCKEAIPALVTLIDKEDEDYFDGALTCLGSVGTSKEAVFLADYLDRDDLTTAQRQSLMRVLGKIKAVETWGKLSEIAQDEDENSFVRMYAAEAIGAMEKPESEKILLKLYQEDDPNFRCYVIKGISYYKDKDADDLIIQALRDSQYKVRLEAVDASQKRKLAEAVPYLIYRCKDKTEENVVKDKCYKVIAELNTTEGNDYLLSVIKDKRAGDNTKAKIASALMVNNYAGNDEIIALAEECLKNEARKSLRYSLGKEFAKYGRPEYEKICAEYIAHKEVSTQGTGLDIFAKGRYASVRPAVEEIAKDAEEEPVEETKPTATDATKKPDEKKKTTVPKKKNANAIKAKRILEQIDSLYKKDSSAETTVSATSTAEEEPTTESDSTSAEK